MGQRTTTTVAQSNGRRILRQITVHSESGRARRSVPRDRVFFRHPKYVYMDKAKAEMLVSEADRINLV